MDEKTAIRRVNERRHAGTTPHGNGEEKNEGTEDGIFFRQITTGLL